MQFVAVRAAEIYEFLKNKLFLHCLAQAYFQPVCNDHEFSHLLKAKMTKPIPGPAALISAYNFLN